MRTCDHCTYCCWAYYIEGMPKLNGAGHPSAEMFDKQGGEQCPYREDWGCRIHDHSRYPKACRDFQCRWLKGMQIHKPNLFEDAIKEVLTAKGTVFPVIPSHVPADVATGLIRLTKAMPEGEKGNPLTMLSDSTQAEKDFAAEKWGEVLGG